jgi:beta-glucosidase
MKLQILLPIVAVSIAACGQESRQSPDAPESNAVRIDPQNWPQQQPVMVRDAGDEEIIRDLLQRMTLEEKVGQVIQADINSVTPDEVREYNLGSVLNGGGSAPGGDNRTTPDKWLELADEFWDASTDTSDGGVGIPAIWGTDAVHGHSNILGATLFPHNIGLGMANDPDLVEAIGHATALEILATGLDWTFAPTVAVARNDRWGRTYESYSEDPRIVTAYAPRIVTGLQGAIGTEEFLDDDHLVATAKHFTGDGGTTDGIDQGDTAVPESEFRDIHSAAYPPAIAAGVQSVMASFNSFHGRKMHGYDEMLTGVLVDRMGFDGFVVGDWNGHGQVAGCDPESCPASINAGLDMFMAPNSWKGLYENLLRQVRDGEVSVQRLDEAVARVLRVKLRLGIFEAGRPSSRKHAGNFELLAAPEHRAIARDAVRKSLVLLKNDGHLLPLEPQLNVLVAGDGAHDIGKQSGGWTLNWQGLGHRREHFPNGTSIYEGLQEAIAAGGGTATLSVDGDYDERPDVAIVVFGEDPYAEGVGDRLHVDFEPDGPLAMLRQLQADGIPTVSVFLSGRPMWVNPEINASNAFVAAWLPGSEGAGIADVIVAGADGKSRYDFAGRLSFSWPRTADDVQLNVGDADYDPLFAYGYGLGYGDNAEVGQLPEVPGLDPAVGDARYLVRFGDAVDPWHLLLREGAGDTMIEDVPAASAGGVLASAPAEHVVQQDSKVLTWQGAASFVVAGEPTDLSALPGTSPGIEIYLQVIEASGANVSVAFGGAEFDVSESVRNAAGEGWQRSVIALTCFTKAGADPSAVAEPLVIRSDGPLVMQVESVRFVESADSGPCD